MMPRGTTTPSIDHALLREGAFELLASSTITRYEREARRLAKESGLVPELRVSAELRARVQTRLLELLEDVASQPLRVPSEFEAAILLCVLVDLDASNAHDVLDRASESSSPWIRSLATRLTTPPPGSEPRHVHPTNDLSYAH
jgi:hypothetical protein